MDERTVVWRRRLAAIIHFEQDVAASSRRAYYRDGSTTHARAEIPWGGGSPKRVCQPGLAFTNHLAFIFILQARHHVRTVCCQGIIRSGAALQRRLPFKGLLAARDAVQIACKRFLVQRTPSSEYRPRRLLPWHCTSATRIFHLFTNHDGCFRWSQPTSLAYW